MSINKLLAKAIAESNMPISRIAEKSGISRQHIYKIINGEKNVSSVTLENICKAIKITPASLYEGEIVKLPEPEPLEENTVRIIGRGGVVKEFKVTDKERKMFEAMLETQDDDPDLKY